MEYYDCTEKNVVFKTGVKSPECLNIKTVSKKKDLLNIELGDLYFKKIKAKGKIQWILPSHRISPEIASQYGYISCDIISHQEAAQFLGIQPASYMIKYNEQRIFLSHVIEIIYDKKLDSTHIIWNLNQEEEIVKKEISKVQIPNVHKGYYQVFWDGKPADFKFVKLP